jgi:hypothetical protein
MAEVLWRPGFPINYTPGGDKTQEALFKNSQEIQKIYRHLNQLAESFDGVATVNIRGFVDTVDQLPGTTSPGMLYSVGSLLYVYTGEAWIRLYINTASDATETKLGLLRLGTLDGVFGLSPTSDNVITEAALGFYDNSKLRGLPPGSIVAYLGDIIPPGYVLCDGLNGTPDLRRKFIRCPDVLINGTEGGSDEVTFEASGIIEHTHDFTAAAKILAHKHQVAGESTETEQTHNHGDNSSIDLAADGVHSHAAGGNFATASYIRSWGAQDETGRVPGHNVTSAFSSSAGGEHSHLVTGTATVDTAFTSHFHKSEGNTMVATETLDVAGEAGTQSTEGAPAIVERVPKHARIAFLMKI